MRADRLVSLVLLLRQRGRMTADALARELEVSTRTVLRDVEALSTAGVPVYTDRGRHGGISLLPGFRTELTGLGHDEALALLTAGSSRGEVFGLGSALASAMRKLVDALPDGPRASADSAARRLLVEPDIDLLARRSATEEIPTEVIDPVRRAVLGGRRLRIRYGPQDREEVERTVDPIGLVTVRGIGYLLATVSGVDRTYRLSRILSAESLAEPADRPADVDLAAIWQERSDRFRAGDDQIAVTLEVDPRRRHELLATAVAVHAESAGSAGRLRIELGFQDARHAEWAVWQLGEDARVLAPDALRHALHRRASAISELYSGI